MACKICAFVLEQDPAGWRVDIVKLAGTHRPRKRCDRHSRDQEGEWEDEVQDDHVGSLPDACPRKARDRSELASTVSELSGMTAAAISGWINPLTARPPATRL